MKLKFTNLFVLCAGLLLSGASFAQSAGDYRSAASGNWNSTSTWETYNGSAWVAAVATPTSADGAITIIGPHNVSITATVAVDQFTINTGATLTMTTVGANITVDNGTGDDMVVNGHLELGAALANARTVTGAGNLVINGTMDMIGSTIGVVTTTGNSSLITFEDNINHLFNSNFTNNGTLNWTTGATAGSVLMTNCTFTNNGTINENFSSSRGFGSSGGTNAFINNGTINKTSTNPMNVVTPVSFTNGASGLITGIGTFSSTGTTVNSGTLSPGLNANTPGILIVTGTMLSLQTTNVIINVVSGAGAGSGHDQLQVSTNANLANATFTLVDNSYSPSAPLQTYVIATNSTTFSNTPALVSAGGQYTSITNVAATSIEVTKSRLFPLPVAWGNVSALAKGKQVNISWSTLQETNTASFDVEVSTNGKDFRSAGSVAAAGNSTAARSYQFVHTTPDLSKVNFYRIRQNDLNGRSTLSEVRQVKFNKGLVAVVTTAPNPVKNVLQVSIQADNVRLDLTDNSGKILSRLSLQPGTHTVDMSPYAAGIYHLVISQNGLRLESQRIIKQ